MRTYHAYYKGRKIELEADSKLDAQDKAAEHFGLKKKMGYLIALVLADVPVSTASL